MEAIAGSVFQRTNGRWVAQYKYHGKHKQVYGKTEDEATKKRQDILDDLNQTTDVLHTKVSCQNIKDELTSVTGETYNEEKLVETDDNTKDNVANEIINNDLLDAATKNINRMTLGGWLSEWLENYVKINKSLATITCYDINIKKHVIPSIGYIALSDLSVKTFQDFFDAKSKGGRLDGKQGGMSPKSIENMRFMLNTAMRQALDNGLIEENHIQNVKVAKPPKQEARALTSEEQNRLIAACTASENVNMFGILIALRTGLQLGELLALKWNDVDLQNKQIYVRQILSRRKVADESILYLKDLENDRTITKFNLSDDFTKGIELYRNKQNRMKNFKPDLIISDKHGKPIDPGNYIKQFKRMLKKASILDANFDILRNTFAVWYLEQGYDPAGLSGLLGYAKDTDTIYKFNRLYNIQKQTANK